jgi:hypothetical protein
MIKGCLFYDNLTIIDVANVPYACGAYIPVRTVTKSYIPQNPRGVGDRGITPFVTQTNKMADAAEM